MKGLLLISGPIAAGKSAVAAELIGLHHFYPIRSGQYLKDLSERQKQGSSRAELQRLGDFLDTTTDYRWLIDDIAAKLIEATPRQDFWLLDSVRKKQQIFHFKEVYGDLVFHAHFFADELVLQQRYNNRVINGDEYTGNTPYETARYHPNEVEARSLIEISDIAFDLGQTSPKKAAAGILKFIQMRGSDAPSCID